MLILKNLSHKLLYNLKLYNKYLNYDYKGLFTDVFTEYNVNHFGKYGIIIKIMANLLSIFLVKKPLIIFLIISTILIIIYLWDLKLSYKYKKDKKY